MVAAELVAGARDARDLRAIDAFLERFDLVEPTAEDARLALDLFRRLRLAHGVDWPDCLIAATALRLDVEVLTLNVKHFASVPGLRVVKAY